MLPGIIKSVVRNVTMQMSKEIGDKKPEIVWEILDAMAIKALSLLHFIKSSHYNTTRTRPCKSKRETPLKKNNI